MNERERWIVYPLLFLALGAALRDKLFDQTNTRRIVCQELIVMDEGPIGGQPLLWARIGRIAPTNSSVPLSGHLYVNGPISVAGTVDAQNYAIQGMPLLSALRTMISPADIWQAWQQSAEAWQKAKSRAGMRPPSGAAEPDAPAQKTTPSESPPPESSD